MKETRAPPPGRFSAQIRPPCASTSPRAIASPSPAPPRRAGRIAAPEALEHPAERLGRQPLARVLDDDGHTISLGLDEDRNRAIGWRVPERVREEVEKHALDLLGRAAGDDGIVDARLEADVPRPRLGLEPAEATVDEPASCASRSSSVSAPLSIRTSSKRSSTRVVNARTCSRRAGR